jgi:hypothetical protein
MLDEVHVYTSVTLCIRCYALKVVNDMLCIGMILE